MGMYPRSHFRSTSLIASRQRSGWHPPPDSINTKGKACWNAPNPWPLPGLGRSPSNQRSKPKPREHSPKRINPDWAVINSSVAAILNGGRVRAMLFISPPAKPPGRFIFSSGPL